MIRRVSSWDDLPSGPEGAVFIGGPKDFSRFCYVLTVIDARSTANLWANEWFTLIDFNDEVHVASHAIYRSVPDMFAAVRLLAAQMRVR